MYASNSRIQNMSNDLPPFVSNSPPPLCHSDSVESDDDFGDFSNNYETYDSPKKKAPDLFNGIIEHSVDNFIPPPSQTVFSNDIPLVNHHINNSNEITNNTNEIPQNYHLTNKKENLQSIFNTDEKELPQNRKDLPQNLEELPQDLKELPQDVKELPQDVKELPQDVKELPQVVKELSQVETIPLSLDEIVLSNQLSNSNHVNSCKVIEESSTEISSMKTSETQLVQSKTSIKKVDLSEKETSVSEDLGALSSNNLEVNSLQSTETFEFNINEEIKPLDDISLKQEEKEERFVSNPQETYNAQSKCDSLNLNENASIEFPAVENCAIDTNCISQCDIQSETIQEAIKAVQETDTNVSTAVSSVQDPITDNELCTAVSSLNISSSSADVCDNQSKPKRGISNEIKKFLEHEKNIENEFTQFESKFRSFDIPSSDVFDTEISSDTPPTSPEFGLKLSKSFDDDLDDDDDDYGTFENFTTDKPDENLEEEDFGDFECSEVVETTLVVERKHEINVDKQEVKPEACFTEDGISTKDIQLEFNEQNICDNNELVIPQQDSKSNSLTEEKILPPPLDVEEIYFEDNATEDIEFETDFSQFESAPIVNHVNNVQLKTCDNNQDSKSENVLFENNSNQASKNENVLIPDENNTKQSSKSENVLTHVENESRSSFFESSQEEEDDGDFGDFSNFTSSVPEIPGPISTFSPTDSKNVPEEPVSTFPSTDSQNDTDDDFGDFTSETVTSVAYVPPPSVENKFDLNSIDMMSLFEKSTQELPECPVSTLDQILSQDEAWRRLHDIENTPALSYQWSNSESNKALLSALNIDTRNIIYGPRWKENVPRFAANLGYSPLEPSKLGVIPGDASSPLQEHIPDAHFDWNGSGLTNPLDGSPSYLLHLDVISVFDTLSSPPLNNNTTTMTSGRSKSSRQTLKEELTVPIPTTFIPPTPVPVYKVLHPQTTTPTSTSRSSQSELIINVDKFVESLPTIGFMLSQQVVFPSK